MTEHYPLGPCDRHPSALAQTAWYNPTLRGIVELCAHDAHLHWVELIAQGFELSIDNRHELVADNRLKGEL